MADENEGKMDVSVSLFGKETDKAAAKVIEVAVGQTTEGVVSTMGNLLGGLVGDRIREWRTRNLIETTALTAKILQEKGVNLDRASALPMGDLYAMFEGASLAEEPEIKVLWAGLLATGLSSNNPQNKKGFFDVLNQINSVEARVLNFLKKSEDEDLKVNQKLKELYDGTLISLTKTGGAREAKANKIRKAHQKKVGSWIHDIKKENSVDIQQAIENLKRLQCIAPADLDGYHHEAHAVIQRSVSIDGFGSRVDTIDPKMLQTVIKSIRDRIAVASGVIEKEASLVNEDGMHGHDYYYKLTIFGRRLTSACSAE